MSKKTFKEQLNAVKELMREQEKEDSVDANQMDLLPSIPDPFGVAVGQDSGVTETRVFVTQFSPNDVNDFKSFLINHPPHSHRYNLETLLKEHLNDWCYDHPGECPYEPFLWALKVTDNYVGSLQNNAMPQPWIVAAVGNALSIVWNDDNPQFMLVLRNVLNGWDWYQPVHVVLYLYKCLSAVNDEDVDRCVREQWLYRALYSMTAFDCLCAKKKSKENIKALMRFVGQDIQRDSNMAEIQITRKMRLAMNSYIQSASENEYAWAKTYYMDSLYNCSRKARQSFEEVFSANGVDDEMQRFISEWKFDHTESEIRALKKKLGNLFEKDAVGVISEAASSKSNKLISEVLKLAEEQELTFHTQFSVRAILNNARINRDYCDFIVRKFEQFGSDFTNDRSFIYGCAFCQLGHPEILADLFRAHYLLSVGLVNGRYLFSDLRSCYSKQFNDQIEKITNICLSDEDSALTLVSSCSKIYTTKNVTTYPVAFDKVCNMLLIKVLDETSESARYASALMDLYERIVSAQNRGRYRDPLQKIALGTHAFALENARHRAKKLIRSIYGAL